MAGEAVTSVRVQAFGESPLPRRRHWFPIASTLELDPQRPTPVRLDGLDLVVWKALARAPDSKSMTHPESPTCQVPGKTEEDGWQVARACQGLLAPSKGAGQNIRTHQPLVDPPSMIVPRLFLLLHVRAWHVQSTDISIF